MAKKHSGKAKRRVPKTVLRLPDLDQAKSAVLNSLSSIDAQRGYRHAIEEFIEWYCSEPRLSCGLRRHEAVNLNFGHVQQPEDHWAIIDLKGKAGHTRTIPMPVWVKTLVDDWIQTANFDGRKATSASQQE